MTVRVRVDSRLRLAVADLPAGKLDELRAAFDHRNPLHFKHKAMGLKFTRERPTIKTWSMDDPATLSLPRGGTERVRAILPDVEFEDCRCVGRDLGSHVGDWVKGDLFPKHRVALWEHQERMVAGIELREQCIIRAGTGSGKTSAVIAAIVRAGLPAIVIVHSTALLRQWQERVKIELGIEVRNQGLIQGSERRLRPLTLAMQQTLWNMKADAWQVVGRSFGFVGVDEVHLAAARTFLTAIDQMPARFRVGASADERRKDQKEFLLYDLFGGVEVDVPRAEVAARGFVLDVAVRLVPTDFAAEWYAKRGVADDARELQDFNKLIEQMTINEPRNEAIVRLAAERVRLGEPMLIFSHRVEHCRELVSRLVAQGVPAGLMIGGPEWQAEFEATKAGLKNGSKMVGVGTYQAIGTGQDIPEVVAGIATTPIHTHRQLVQQVTGRLCRRADGKLGATLFYLWDREVYGQQPARAFKRWHQDVRALAADGQWVLASEIEEVKHDWAGEPFVAAR